MAGRFHDLHLEIAERQNVALFEVDIEVGLFPHIVEGGIKNPRKNFLYLFDLFVDGDLAAERPSEKL